MARRGCSFAEAMPRAPDAYEKDNIAAPSEVLHRDKQVSRALAVAMLAMTALFLALAAGGMAGTAEWPAVVMMGTIAAAFAFVGLTRSVVRTAITEREMRVHWGLWGPRIALAGVKAVSVRKRYDRAALTAALLEEGSPRVEMIAIPHRGDIIDITWTDDSGRARRSWIGAGDAAELAAAIRRGMARAQPGLRIADEDSSAQAVEAEDQAIEAEELAVEEAAVEEAGGRLQKPTPPE
jgi:hypothetical protein